MRIGIPVPLFDPIDLGIGLFEGIDALVGAGAAADAGAGAAIAGADAAGAAGGIAAGDAAAAGLGADAALAGGVAGDAALGIGAAGSDVAMGGMTDAALGLGSDSVAGTAAATTEAIETAAPAATGPALTAAGGAGFEAPMMAGLSDVSATAPGEGVIATAGDEALLPVGTAPAGAPVPAPDLTGAPVGDFGAPAQFESAAMGGPDSLGLDVNMADTGGASGSVSGTNFDPTGADVLPGGGGGGGSSAAPDFGGSAAANTPPTSSALSGDTTAAATKAASGGSSLDNALKYMRLGGGALGLAGIANAFMTGDKLPKQSRTAEDLANREGAFANELISMSQNNQILPGQQEQIERFKAEQNAKAYQLAVAAGGGGDPRNSSMYLQTAQDINSQAEVMHQQFIDSNMKTALAAAGGSEQALLAIAQLQVQMDQGLSTAIGNAARAMGGMPVGLKIG